MNKKSTEELEKILGNTHLDEIDSFMNSHGKDMLSEETSFSNFLRETIKNHGMTQQRVFIEADLPERYGYKLISGEKKTRQRDVILRICYAAKFTLEQTQHVLKLYEMPQLYAKIPRDAVIMIAFNEHRGSIIDVNELLQQQGMEPLRTSGIQE